MVVRGRRRLLLELLLRPDPPHLVVPLAEHVLQCVRQGEEAGAHAPQHQHEEDEEEEPDDQGPTDAPGGEQNCKVGTPLGWWRTTRL